MMSLDGANRRRPHKPSGGWRPAPGPCRSAGCTGLPTRWAWTALLSLPDQEELPVAAILDHKGAHALGKTENIYQPTIEPAMVALRVKSSVGDYRAGDDVWLSRRTPEQFGGALNRDILVPRPAGRYLFGRLIGREDNRLQILPLGSGARQQIVSDPGWIGVAVRLVREL